eukprot:TRINITY_DN4607_c0_g1_i1.p1 TRINITY_DN4607_c0_g1~~TRINITY_DN4607_c0_g1_i1.p1  ORF type:complete len:341 (+),score=71.34 TRINITY_DN4607_c0_g1_i1:15-1037(+)
MRRAWVNLGGKRVSTKNVSKVCNMKLGSRSSVRRKHHAILWCDDHQFWEEEKNHIWADFLRSTEHSKDTFELFNVFASELPDPTAENLAKYDGGIALSGSRHGVGDSEKLKWILELFDWIRKYHRLVSDVNVNNQNNNNDNNNDSKRVPRLMASCFGHQVIAHSLGGKVGPNEWTGLDGNRFRVGLDWVTLHQDFLNLSFVKKTIKELDLKLKFNPNLNLDYDRIFVIQSHGDSVLSLPDPKVAPTVTRALGTSDVSKNEIYMVGDNILCFQGHPEYQTKHIQKIILPRLVSVNRIDSETRAIAELEMAQAKGGGEREMSKWRNDQAFLKQLIRNFLDGQ